MALTPKKINTGILSTRLNKNKVCQLGIVFASNDQTNLLHLVHHIYIYTYSYINLYFKTSYQN